MRRRIYVAPDGSGLEDVTDRPYRYHVNDDLALGALYDDPIWIAYVAAREALAVLESAVIGHLRGEPYDEVERQAAAEWSALRAVDCLSMERVPKMEEITARVLAHAEDLYGNGEAPR